MNIKGNKLEISRKAEDVFAFISDFRNFEKLMPEQIVNWQSDGDTCSFDIQGMASIELRMVEKNAPTLLKIEAEGRSPFPFSLMTHLQDLGENQCETYFEIEAKINPMMSMMVKRPLENLVNIMNEKLKEHVENMY